MAKYYQNLSKYLFSFLCHDYSKKVKALASLHRFLQKNPFNGKILPEAVLIVGHKKMSPKAALIVGHKKKCFIDMKRGF